MKIHVVIITYALINGAKVASQQSEIMRKYTTPIIKAADNLE